MGSNNVHNPYFVKLSQNCFTSANNVTHFSQKRDDVRFALKDIRNKLFIFEYKKNYHYGLTIESNGEHWDLRLTDLEWTKIKKDDTTYLCLTWAGKQHFFPQYQHINGNSFDQWCYIVPTLE
jgi:hypothetical protein